MNSDRLRELLTAVSEGQVDVDTAVDQVATLPFLDTEHARIDTHRSVRQGISEVIYGEFKTAEQIIDGARALQSVDQEVLATRISEEKAVSICEALPKAVYDSISRVLYIGADTVPIQGKGKIIVVSAGSADMPVAAEAQQVAQRLGNEVELLQDVGVAGLHRLLAALDVLRSARVLIVVAGMEGALPSVVGGLVAKPVIAVPTSVGYGVAMGGMAALMGMLTSCASNVTTVNIDNGFGAAHVATLINRL